MPTISKLAVVLTGGIAGFSASMAAGGKALDGFTDHFKSAAGSIAAIGATLGAGAAVAGIVSLTKSSFENIAATGRLSDSLGIATQTLSQMDYAAKVTGVSTEGLHAALFKMEKVLGGADEEGGKAAAAIEALGLHTSDLVNLQPDEAFGKIADALNQVGNASDRNAEAAKIFGKGVVEILPLLDQGSDGLARFKAEAVKLGVSFTRVDAAKIEAANQAIEHMRGVLEGAANQLAVKLAPFVEALANKLTALAMEGDGLSGALINAFEGAVKAVAIAADYLELLKAGFNTLRSGADWALFGIVEGLSFVGKGIDWILDKLGMAEIGVSDYFAKAGEHLKADAVESWRKAGENIDAFTNGENSAKVDKFFDGIRASSQKAAEAVAKAKAPINGASKGLDEAAAAAKKVDETIAGLQKTVDQFNMSKAERAADDIKRMGGDDAHQEQARKLQEQIDQMEEAKKAQEDMARDAKSLWDETRTPLEKYNAEMAKLNALLDDGAIDQDTFARASQKYQDELDKSGEKKGTDYQPASLLREGSAEAASFVARIQSAQRGGDDPQMQLVKHAAAGNDLLKRIADNTGNANAAIEAAQFN